MGLLKMESYNDVTLYRRYWEYIPILYQFIIFKDKINRKNKTIFI